MMNHVGVSRKKILWSCYGTYLLLTSLVSFDQWVSLEKPYLNELLVIAPIIHALDLFSIPFWGYYHNSGEGNMPSWVSWENVVFDYFFLDRITYPAAKLLVKSNIVSMSFLLKKFRYQLWADWIFSSLMLTTSMILCGFIAVSTSWSFNKLT